MSLKIISCNHPTSITNSVKKLIPAYIKPDDFILKEMDIDEQ